MRRLSAVLALLLLAALPASSPAAPPDLARGHGEVATLATSFSFHARSDALNTPGTASGRMVLQTAAFSAVAEVDCLSVAGNRATMIGRITQSTGLDPLLYSGRLVFIVEDNHGSTPDEFSYVVELLVNPPEPCIPQDPLHQVTRGNITVHDH